MGIKEGVQRPNKGERYQDKQSNCKNNNCCHREKLFHIALIINYRERRINSKNEMIKFKCYLIKPQAVIKVKRIQ